MLSENFESLTLIRSLRLTTLPFLMMNANRNSLELLNDRVRGSKG
jgi:hypothetical protein